MPNEEPPATIEGAFQSGVLPDALRRFVVNDLTDHLRPCSGQVVMLFESPHIMEVLAGHPLAGMSGRRVFDAFYDRVRGENYPYTIGEVLQYWLFNQFSCFQHIGIMNVSRLPLQKKSYPYSIQRQFPSHLLSTFNVIRSAPCVLASKRHKKHRYFAKIICNDLQYRITRLERRLGAGSIKFVTCGTVAKSYAKHLNIITCIKLSHPAAGNWKNSNGVSTMVNWFRNFS